MQIYGRDVIGLINSGASCNLMRQDFFEELKLELQPIKEVMTGAGGQHFSSLGRTVATTTIDGVQYPLIYKIVTSDCIPDKIIVGNELRQLANIHLLKDDTIVTPGEDYVRMIMLERTGKPEFEETLSMKYEEELKTIVSNYEPTGGEKAPIEMRIRLKDEAPISRNPRRLSETDLRQVNALIDEWLDAGIVRRSTSEFAAPIVVVRKKDGSIRICVDLTLLNKVVFREDFPIPLIEDVLDKLAKTNVFCTLHIKDGFFHVNVAKESRKYLSFVTPSGQYEYCKAPQ